MEKAISKGYSYSVLDCNSAVERCRQGPASDVYFEMEEIEFMEADTEQPPDEFDSFDEEIETDYKCPDCGYEWSGGQN